MTAKLVFIRLIVIFCCNSVFFSFAQDDDPILESNDPIKESIAQKEYNFEGMNLTEKEFNYLTRINEKYKITGEEQRLRRSNGDTLNLKEKYRIARSYRKEYVKTKKILKFRKKKFESIQNKETLKRMREKEKRAKSRYRSEKWNARKRKFLNLFK